MKKGWLKGFLATVAIIGVSYFVSTSPLTRNLNLNFLSGLPRTSGYAHHSAGGTILKHTLRSKVNGYARDSSNQTGSYSSSSKYGKTANKINSSATKGSLAGKYTIISRINTNKDSNIIKAGKVVAWNGVTTSLTIDRNKANFTAKELERAKQNPNGFEYFSSLDSEGRSGQANALITTKTLGTAPRTSLSSEPSGWVNPDTHKSNNVKVTLSSGAHRYFYDRCHLIGYQLGGVNDVRQNFVTGAREFNTPGMLQYENKVATAAKAGHKVLYQVTPIYFNSDLVPRGVQMRAYSVDDGGKSCQFNAFVYNGNRNFAINYQNGQVKY